jgi:hypothetical protein
VPVTLLAVCPRTGRRRASVRLAIGLAGGVAAFLVFTEFASAGRAVTVWAACMFGGSDPQGTLTALLSGSFAAAIRYSHLVGAVSVVSIAVLLASIGLRRSADSSQSLAPIVPLGIWAGATLAMAVALSSPGTIPTNQVPEWIAASLVVVAMAGNTTARLGRLTGFSLLFLVLWMSAQNVSLAVDQQRQLTPEIKAHRSLLLERIRTQTSPVLAESALWPVLAGRKVVLLDAFAAHIVMRSRPELERELIETIAARRYSLVILEFDPESPQGRRIYAATHFGADVIAAIEANYRLDERMLPNAFILVPR